MPGIARHTPTLTGDRVIRMVNADVALLPDLSDAIAQLTNASEWIEIGDPIDDVLAECWLTLESYYLMDLIGSVTVFMVSVPAGWLALDGSVHAEADYPELALVLPSHFKSGGNFTLPDMTGVFMAGDFTLSNMGTGAGANSYALAVGQLPSHNHTYTPPVMTINAETPTTPVPAAGIGAPTNTGNTGSGDSIDNRPEFSLFALAVYAGRP